MSNTTAATAPAATVSDVLLQAAAASGLLLAQIEGTTQAEVVRRDLHALTVMAQEARAAEQAADECACGQPVGHDPRRLDLCQGCVEALDA